MFVCSRRKNDGQAHGCSTCMRAFRSTAEKLGFDNLSPIIWHKISNAAHEVENGSGGFLGKPYEPNAVIKNDIEFILMERKSGGYRTPSAAVRDFSVSFRPRSTANGSSRCGTGLTGASTRDHPAPYPVELAERLIRMFSFVGDTVLDPFMGTGTTALAASKCGRNSVNFEIDKVYLEFAAQRLQREISTLFANPVIVMD